MNNNQVRNYALDLLRGLTIALMIVVNNPGDWKEMFTVLRHAEWHGFLGADIVFPLFLFVAGYAAALKINRLYAPFSATGPHCASALTLEEHEVIPFYLPLFRRAVILFFIGVFLNAWPFGLVPGSDFSLEKLRVFGVLQRIAICVLIGGMLLRRFMTVKHLVWVLISIAAVYEICMRVPLVHAAAEMQLACSENAALSCATDVSFGRSFDLKDNFARFIDTSLLPATMLYKIQKIPFDPEGVFTSLTAVMTFLLGGLTLRLSNAPKKNRQLLLLGFFLAASGIALLAVEPVNKNLWTLPYVLLMGAAGVILLLLLGQIRNGQKTFLNRLAQPFAEMGRNPLLIYVLSVIVGKTLALWKITGAGSVKQYLYGLMLMLPASPKLVSLLYSLVLLLLLALLSHRLRKLSLVIR